MSEPTAAESPENETQPRQKTREIILRTAAAVGAAALLFLLDGAANQHEWAVGWLRRYEKFSPFTLLALISLERLAVAFVLFLPFAVIDKLRKAPEEPKKPEKSLLRKCIVDPIQSTLLYAAPILVMKLAGAGMGTQALAAACVFTAAKCKKPKFLLMVAPSLYMGFAFAHWANSSWLLAVGMTSLGFAVAEESLRLLAYSLGDAAAVLVVAPIEAVKQWRSFAVFTLIAAALIWSGAGDWMVEWFQGRYGRHSPWAFCWRISLEHSIASVPFWYLGTIAAVFFKKRSKPQNENNMESDEKEGADGKLDENNSPNNKQDAGQNREIGFSFEFPPESPYDENAASILIAPVAETLSFQAVPIALLGAAGASLGAQLIVSAALFAWLHYLNSIKKGIGAGILGGVYLGYPFVRWHSASYWTAFWVTAVSHSLRNLFSTAAHQFQIYKASQKAVRKFARRLKKRLFGEKNNGQ